MDVSTKSPPAEPAFHAEDVEEIAGYHTLSALAIVGLVLGLLSPLCFISPLLLAIPVFGAAVSILAMRRIAVSEGALAGRGAAATGLVLCVAVGVAAVSREAAIRYLRTQQAAEFGSEWLSLLVAGHAKAAFGLTVQGARPTPPPEPGVPPQTTDPYDEFLKQPVINEAMSATADSQVKLVQTLAYEPQPQNQYRIRQRFRIMPTAAPPANMEDAEQPREVVLVLQRSRFAGERSMRWLVAAIEDPNDDAAAPWTGG